MKKIDLANGGYVIHIPGFISAGEATACFAKIKNQTAWEQKKALFGHMQPRLTAAYGDDGLVYRYSNTENKAATWNSIMSDLKLRVEGIDGRYNYCLLNLYRDGKDSVALHADDEPGIGEIIGSVSLGETRVFRLKHNTTGEKMEFELDNGSLLIMGGTTQRFWKHEVPKTKKSVGERINLTFRNILK